MKKNYLLFFAILASCVTARSQSTPEALLGKLPAVPSNICTADRAVIDHFMEQVSEVQAALKQETDRRGADVQADIDKSKGRIVDDAIRQSGLHKGDVNKLKQSDGSEKERRKAADNVVSEKYGVSLQELEKVSEMSETEQKQWALKIAEQMQSQAMNDPKAVMRKDDKNRQLVALAKEEKSLMEVITERMNRVTKIFNNLEELDSIERRNFVAKLRPLQDQICSGICSDEEVARSKAAEKEIYALKVRFCEKMSPIQADALSQYLTAVKSLLPIYRQLADIGNEMVELQQVGIKLPRDAKCYSAVDSYAAYLKGAYKYWVGKFENTSPLDSYFYSSHL